MLDTETLQRYQMLKNTLQCLFPKDCSSNIDSKRDFFPHHFETGNFQNRNFNEANIPLYSSEQFIHN